MRTAIAFAGLAIAVIGGAAVAVAAETNSKGFDWEFSVLYLFAVASAGVSMGVVWLSWRLGANVRVDRLERALRGLLLGAAALLVLLIATSLFTPYLKQLSESRLSFLWAITPIVAWSCFLVGKTAGIRECHENELARIPPLRGRPRLFVASAGSAAAQELSQAICSGLAPRFEPVFWRDGFKAGDMTLLTLNAVHNYDAGVFVMTPEDTLTGDPPRSMPRQNVVFELGMFAGRLSFQRTFIVVPRSQALELPSDLDGLTLCYYTDGGEPADRVAACVAKIREQLGE